jgi:hypothetical protein
MPHICGRLHRSSLVHSSTALRPDHFASWTAYVKYVGDQLTMQFIFVQSYPLT